MDGLLIQLQYSSSECICDARSEWFQCNSGSQTSNGANNDCNLIMNKFYLILFIGSLSALLSVEIMNVIDAKKIEKIKC